MILSDEEKILQATLRKFVADQIKPFAQKMDQCEEFSWEIWRGFSSLGLMGIGIDPELGGTEGTCKQMVLAVEEISRGDAASAVSLLVHRSLGLETVAQFGSEQQKAEYIPKAVSGENIFAWALTEPGSGSDAGAMTTTATLREGVYYLNGAKSFITNGDIADTLVVFATTDISLGHRGVCAFIVDKGSYGFKSIKQSGKMGMRASHTAELIFEETPVPAEKLLGREGYGFYYAMNILDSSRIVVAAQSVGIAQACFEEAVSYSEHRHTFGKPISNHQAIQFKLADMATAIYASRAMTYNAALLKDSGLPYVQEASMAKLFASEACFNVASEALQIFGGMGYFQGANIERYFRDARVTSIYEGTSEVQRMVIARRLLEQHGT